jgi:deoxyribodipyrimidine photo-lyase
MTGSAPLILWLKRDLRVEDHAVLTAAAAAGPVLPLYIVEPGLWAQPDYSGRQFAFLRETLEELRESLAALGQPLIVRVGEAVEVLRGLAAETGAARLVSHEETGNGWTYDRDKRVADWARSAGITWEERPQAGVHRRLKSRNGWARAWDEIMARPFARTPEALAPIDGVEPGALPAAEEIGLAPDPCPQRQTGGRRRGLSELDSFLTLRGEPYRKAMSAPGPGAVHCSRVSPYLALGALSMRETAQAGRARRAQLSARGEGGGWPGSISSFLSRLHWRDHFMQKLEDEPRLEFRAMHSAYDDLRPASPDPDRLRAWSLGETGLPFVDACMRCLIATGWMNFRMRAMLMSVASYHLWLPWRATGEVLARRFTDYEPGIHWPQVQMQSGVTGVNSIRIYNPVKQGHDQDPGGDFIARWAPELAGLPPHARHEPWRFDEGRALLGRCYPEPIVDVASAARDAKEAIFAARKSAGFKEEKSRILKTHASRATPPGRRRGKPSSPQMTFKF